MTFWANDWVKIDVRPHKEDEPEEKKDVVDALDVLKTTAVVCKICGQSGHFTLKCPKRTQLMPGMSSSAAALPEKKDIKGEAPPADDANAAAAGPAKYKIPIRVRDREQQEQLSLRVSNLSEVIVNLCIC